MISKFCNMDMNCLDYTIMTVIVYIVQLDITIIKDW